MRINVDIPACSLDIEWEPDTRTLYIEGMGYTQELLRKLANLDEKLEIEKNDQGDLILRRI